MGGGAVANLIEALYRRHLLDSGQIADLNHLTASFKEPDQLIAELTSRGWLTPYQAEVVLQGRADELLLGSYVLLDKLGEGGMGAVFRARNWKFGRICAVKLIRKGRLTDADAVRRFYHEIRAAAQLEHTNVVRAYDADEVNGVHFLVMEYVDGVDLARLVREHGPVPFGLACEYIRQAALGLQHAHERGLVHRDIKPANLLLARGAGAGAIKVLDMGLARLNEPGNDHSSTLTEVGAIMGTPDFMAPEQSVSARTVDIRADLYSLGCSLYFLLTGSVPFPGGSLTEKLLKHQMDQPRPIEMLRPDTPAVVADIVYKLLAKNREDRYQTPAELAAALALPAAQTFDSVANESNVHVETSGVDPFWQGIVAQASIERTATSRKNKRQRVAMIAVPATCLALLVGALAYLNLGSRDKNHAPGPSEPRPPVIGHALLFDGVAAHVTVPDFKYQGDHPLTVECWALPRRMNADMKLLGNNEGNGVSLGILKGAWMFAMHDGEDFRYALGAEAAVDRRVHVAAVFDGKEMRLYMDGKLQGKTEWAGSHKAGDVPLVIGANPAYGSARTEHFAGVIDEVRISRIVRYRDDFEPAKRFEPDRSTIALYHFDEGDDTIAFDASASNMPGTIYKATWVREDAALPAATDAAPPLAIAPFAEAEAKRYQQFWADHLGRQAFETNSVGMKLALIPPGEFLMGQDANAGFFPERGPRHKVRLTAPFFIGSHEVTQEAYEKVMGNNPAAFNANSGGGPLFPVEKVSAEDALAFCERLSALPAEKQAGRRYRLPTEAEWEYAARAGVESYWVFGNGQMEGKAHFNMSSPCGVGRYPANAWGLFDVHGNMSEWCADWFDPDYYKNSPVENPPGPPNDLGHGRVLRGGSWRNSNAGALVLTVRYGGASQPPRSYSHGFRVVCEIGPPPLAVAPFDEKKAKEYQRLWANHLGCDIEETNNIGMCMTLIPPGEFVMGSSEAEVADLIRNNPEVYAPFLHAETPQRRVTIPQPFRMGTCEVTVAQFRRFALTTKYDAGEKPPRPDDRPVGFITRGDADAFCAWLSTVEKRLYRLPTEAEWEYACRAGTTGQRFFSDGELGEYAWIETSVHPVGQLRANPFGLYDIYGNAGELCADNAKIMGGVERDLCRGGGAGAQAVHCRSAARIWPKEVNSHRGFRVVCEIDAAPWRPLFNGQDLNGWSTIPANLGDEEAGLVQDGVAAAIRLKTHSNPGPATKITHLQHEDSLDDYHMRLEFKLSGDTTSRGGVGARFGGGNVVFSFWTQGVFQVGVHDGQARAGLLQNGRIVPDGEPARHLHLAGRDLEAGRWHRLDFYRLGDTCVCRLNDQLLGIITEMRAITDGKEEPVTQTRPVLVAHRGTALFRKVEIRRISALPAEVFK